MEERISLGRLITRTEQGFVIWDRKAKEFRICSEISIERCDEGLLAHLKDVADIGRSYGISRAWKYNLRTAAAGLKYLYRKIFAGKMSDMERNQRNEGRDYPWF